MWRSMRGTESTRIHSTIIWLTALVLMVRHHSEEHTPILASRAGWPRYDRCAALVTAVDDAKREAPAAAKAPCCLRKRASGASCLCQARFSAEDHETAKSWVIQHKMDSSTAQTVRTCVARQRWLANGSRPEYSMNRLTAVTSALSGSEGAQKLTDQEKDQIRARLRSGHSALASCRGIRLRSDTGGASRPGWKR